MWLHLDFAYLLNKFNRTLSRKACFPCSQYMTLVFFIMETLVIACVSNSNSYEVLLVTFSFKYQIKMTVKSHEDFFNLVVKLLANES